MRHTRTTVCTHNCPDACSIRVVVEDGRIVAIQGDPEHPITQGFLCGKVNRYAERVYSERRIRTPLRRVGAKGEGRFEPISWDEALDTVAANLRRVAETHGAEAVLPYSYSGSVAKIAMNAGHRFFHRLGASRLARTICSTQAAEGQACTTGPDLASDPETIPHSKLVILWGSNAVSTNIHLMPFIRQARKNGARLVVIDPHRNHTARQADWHLPVRPGTDIPLALGLMHVLIAEGLYDADFVARYTVGFEALRAAVAAYTPGRVAEITGLAADDVVGLARAYGATKAAFIRMGLGLTRRRDGAMAVRTVACLPCLTGAWEVPGGGFMRQGWAYKQLDLGWLTAPRPEDPPARTVNMVRLGEALTTLADPPVKALFVYNSNPAAVAPAQARVLAGLAREDLFVAVHDVMFTDTTDFADIVLPAPTFMEQDDLVSGGGNRHVQVARAAIAPEHEARPNRQVFAELWQRMGWAPDPVYTEPFEALVRRLLHSPWTPAGGWDEAALWAGRPLRFAVPEAPWSNGGLRTPSGRFELASDALAARGVPAVPTWTPSPEGDEPNDLKVRYPLQLLTPHAHHFINSSLVETAASQRLEGGPAVRLHPEDAAARGLADGAACRVYNDRGACTLTVRVTDAVRPGVAVADSVWWPRLHAGRANVNQLTSLEQTDLGGGARFQECLVQVAPAPAGDAAD